MKHTTTILFLLGTGCSFPTVATPGSCGLWDSQDPLDDEDDSVCGWASVLHGRGAVRSDDSCPDSDDTCAVSVPGETIRVWAETTAGLSVFAFAYAPNEAGECYLRCDDTGPCAPYEDICIPCAQGVDGYDTPTGRVYCPEE